MPCPKKMVASTQEKRTMSNHDRIGRIVATKSVEGSAYAALVGAGKNDTPFLDPNIDDGRRALFVELKACLRQMGVDLHTDDMFKHSPTRCDLEIHVNARSVALKSLRPCYVLLLENQLVRPLNQDYRLLKKYRKIFSWRKDLPNQHNVQRIAAYPVPIRSAPVDGWSSRTGFACMVAANKSMADKSSVNLYLERLKTIRWWQKNHPQHFDLYGLGWNMPESSKSVWGALVRAWYRANSTGDRSRFFPGWKGPVASKTELMSRYRFAFCYENVAGLPGYVTEKIFDAMGAGCLPIYWGAPDIHEFIPEECFIDRRKFATHEELWRYLNGMTESEFCERQAALFGFMTSDQAKAFSAQHFGQTVAEVIANDFFGYYSQKLKANFDSNVSDEQFRD